MSKMTQLTATVEVSWEKLNYLQSGTLCIDCDCYSPQCNHSLYGNYHSVSWEQSDRSLFEQTYRGHYAITKSPQGYPEINGGHYRHDFTDTEQDIENHIIPEEYRNKIKVVFNYLQDDREFKANSLDMFF
jgi:hypothetical protein